MNARNSAPSNSGNAWPGSKMKGMSRSANSRACLIIASRVSGATMPNFASLTAATSMSTERTIAPGWNAVIWLSSRSVVMYACAV